MILQKNFPNLLQYQGHKDSDIFQVQKDLDFSKKLNN